MNIPGGTKSIVEVVSYSCPSLHLYSSKNSTKCSLWTKFDLKVYRATFYSILLGFICLKQGRCISLANRCPRVVGVRKYKTRLCSRNIYTPYATGIARILRDLPREWLIYPCRLFIRSKIRTGTAIPRIDRIPQSVSAVVSQRLQFFLAFYSRNLWNTEKNIGKFPSSLGLRYIDNLDVQLAAVDIWASCFSSSIFRRIDPAFLFLGIIPIFRVDRILVALIQIKTQIRNLLCEYLISDARTSNVTLFEYW